MTFSVASVKDVLSEQSAYQLEYLFVVHFEAVVEVIYAVRAPAFLVNIQIDQWLAGLCVVGLCLPFVDSLQSDSTLLIPLLGKIQIDLFYDIGCQIEVMLVLAVEADSVNAFAFTELVREHFAVENFRQILCFLKNVLEIIFLVGFLCVSLLEQTIGGWSLLLFGLEESPFSEEGVFFLAAFRCGLC
jgi:hypothetical protein